MSESLVQIGLEAMLQWNHLRLQEGLDWWESGEWYEQQEYRVELVGPRRQEDFLVRNSQRCGVKASGDEMQECYQWVAGEQEKRWLNIKFAKW